MSPAFGPEIGIARAGVPYGLLQKRVEPGYLLTNGIALLESERDAEGRYTGGAGMDGMYLATPRRYVPVRSENGEVRAFREVMPENYLKNAEMSVEANYNQLDGIINGEVRKPSVREALRQYQEDAAQRAGAPPDKAMDRGR